MNISTKGRYALQLLTYLGVEAESGRLISLKQVASSEGLSEKYLWQVASQLKAAGLINALPGPRGGFVLSKPASSISLAEALVVFEPALFRASAAGPDPSAAQRTVYCSVVEDHLRQLDDKLERLLLATTIGDLVTECRTRQGGGCVYQI